MARKNSRDKGLFQREKITCPACHGEGGDCARCQGAGKLGTGAWWICWVGPDGKTRVRKIGDKRAAQAAYHRAKGDPEAYLPAEQRTPRTISEMIDAYLRESQSTKRSARDDARYGAVWKAWLGSRSLDEVRPADVEAWRQLRSSQKPRPAPATLNRHVAFLKRVFNVAIRDELTERNPAARVKLLAEENLVLRYLDDPEEDRLLPLLEWPLLGMVEVALHTGLRQTEQLSLRREHVDLRRRVLRIPRSKSGAARAIRLNDVALESLRRQLASHDSEWVYPAPVEPRGRQVDERPGHMTYASIRVAWESALDAADVRNFRWHDLRHTFASRLVMEGVTLPAVQQLLGHRSLAMVQRYAHLAPKHLEDAVSRLCKRTATGTATESAEE